MEENIKIDHTKGHITLLILDHGIWNLYAF